MLEQHHMNTLLFAVITVSIVASLVRPRRPGHAVDVKEGALDVPRAPLVP